MTAFSALPDYFLSVGFSLIPGVTRVAALGSNPDVDTGTLPEDIWPGGGQYPFMTAATSLEIVSSSASDASAGVGARTVLVSGLDINYVAISETVTLNGTTPVALVNQYFRVNNARVSSAGTSSSNVGTLTIRDSGGGTSRAIIPLIGTIGAGITRQAVYTVPAGFSLQIISQYVGLLGSGTGHTVDITNYIHSSTGVVLQPLTLNATDGNPYRHDGIPGIIVAEKTDYTLRATAVSNDNTSVTAGFLGIQRRN